MTNQIRSEIFSADPRPESRARLGLLSVLLFFSCARLWCPMHVQPGKRTSLPERWIFGKYSRVS